MANKRTKEGTSKEIQGIKENSREAIDKTAEVADFAAKTKEMLASLEGEAFIETTQAMKQANEFLQDSIDETQEEVVEEAEEIDEQFDEEKESLDNSIEANRSDMGQLSDSKKKADRAKVSDAGIANAEKAKQEEIAFSETEAKGIESAVEKMQKRIAEEQRKRESNRASYGS
ncbi:MAG: hypothetical protein KME26_18860 [Oscillatoria princeps RMCB-10]|jgi:chromosome segregation ATPase|nr:hypothetical protein [Oscillatoria princeps RMCB-10]